MARREKFTVTLDKTSTEVVHIDYQTVDGTAVAGVHYIATSGTLVFNPGETSKDIHVPVTSREIGTRRFKVQLINAVGASITDGEGEGTLASDVITVDVADATLESYLPPLLAQLSIRWNDPAGLQLQFALDPNGPDTDWSRLTVAGAFAATLYLPNRAGSTPPYDYSYYSLNALAPLGGWWTLEKAYGTDGTTGQPLSYALTDWPADITQASLHLQANPSNQDVSPVIALPQPSGGWKNYMTWNVVFDLAALQTVTGVTATELIQV